jgi:hypothetical protein
LKLQLEATWPGAAGITAFRVGDISIGGCFIYSRSQPAVGHETIVTLTNGSESLALPATVVHVDTGMGFSVRFGTAGTLGDRLKELLDGVVAA